MKIHQNPFDKQGQHWGFLQMLGECFVAVELVVLQWKEERIAVLLFDWVGTRNHLVVDTQLLVVPFFQPQDQRSTK